MQQQLSPDQKSEIRKRLFLHLDGWVLAPSLYNLYLVGVLDLFLKKRSWCLNDICSKTQTNEGYINVALRLLASQGYLERAVDNEKDSIQLMLTNLGEEAFKKVERYKAVHELISDYSVRPRNIISCSAKIEALEEALKQLNAFRKNQITELDERIVFHIEGILIGAMLVGLGIEEVLQSIDEKTVLTHTQLKLPLRTFNWFMQLLETMGYLLKPTSKGQLTTMGIQHFKRASAYGVTLSYLPTFAQLDTLFKGDANELWKKNEEGHESHIYRYMNVWGSGGAHLGYFKKVDQIVIELFNRPINEQPKGIIDVGCGDGSFITHVHKVICEKTQRGKQLDKYPLFIMGVDFNEKARIATKKRLQSEKINAHVAFGDISRPKELSQMLEDKHNIQLSDLLNTRTFLDHNRIYQTPENTILSCKSDGAFAFRGRRIPNNELFQNLSNHLKSWAPYISKYGLLIVELHSINPAIAFENIGKTLATPYEGTHGYSDQYIVELPIFLNAAKRAGLLPLPGFSYKIPHENRASVSIQLLRGQ